MSSCKLKTIFVYQGRKFKSCQVNLNLIGLTLYPIIRMFYSFYSKKLLKYQWLSDVATPLIDTDDDIKPYLPVL